MDFNTIVVFMLEMINISDPSTKQHHAENHARPFIQGNFV